MHNKLSTVILITAFRLTTTGLAALLGISPEFILYIGITLNRYTEDGSRTIYRATIHNETFTAFSNKPLEVWTKVFCWFE